MKLKIIDNATNTVVYERDTISGVSWTIDGGDFVARTTGPKAAAGDVFPNYGTSKGMPIKGASMRDLEFYRTGAERTLNDPSKERFHEKEREFLAKINAEIQTQQPGDSKDSIPF